MIVASVAMQIALVSVVGQPAAETLTQQYRSSQLGFSIKFPEGWQKGRALICGNTYMDLDEAGMRRAELYPVNLYSSPRSGVEMSIAVRREIGERIQGTAKDPDVPVPQPFDMRLPLTATKWSQFSDLPDLPIGSESWLVYYTIEQGGRRIRLSGICPVAERAKHEPTFDAMARSLSMFEPAEDRRQEDGVKTYRSPRFTFEYPGPWIIVGVPYDDEEAAKSSDHGTIRGPRDFGVKHGEGESGQQLRFGPGVDRKYNDLAFEDEVNFIASRYSPELLKRKVTVESREFVTVGGLRGRRMVITDPLLTKQTKKQEREAASWAKKNNRPVPPVCGGDCSVYYFLPLDDKTTEVFSDNGCATTNLKETLDRYDEIVRSFKEIRRPGEESPPVLLSP